MSIGLGVSVAEADTANNHLQAPSKQWVPNTKIRGRCNDRLRSSRSQPHSSLPILQSILTITMSEGSGI